MALVSFKNLCATVYPKQMWRTFFIAKKTVTGVKVYVALNETNLACKALVTVGKNVFVLVVFP